jgi:hypothetical protein
MRCFDTLLGDFVVAARSGQISEPRTEIQRRAMAVLTQKAIEQGYEFGDGFIPKHKPNTNRCEVLVTS